jgi:hypothetical protein
MQTYEIYINSIDEFINHNDINSVKNSVDALEKELYNLESSFEEYVSNGCDLALDTINDLQIMQHYILKGKTLINEYTRKNNNRTKR